MKILRIQKGLTLIELLISLIVLSILGALVASTYLFGARTIQSYQTHGGLRASLGQAMQKAVNMIRQAKSIDSLTESRVVFTADLGEGDRMYRLYLYHPDDAEPNPPYTQETYQIRLAIDDGDYGAGSVLVSEVQPSAEPPFAMAGSLMTLDWTVLTAQASLRLRTKVSPRNL